MDCKPRGDRASLFAMKNLICSVCLLVISGSISVNAQIYADVSTSMGDFTIQLEYTKAPQTVANFIRLAEGSAPWVDFSTGRVRQEPYYNGVTFHRVINGFMSQTGSRKGDGTDGPGYQFKDEFSSLTHTGPYVVSMANSGPNTNGSQIFITASTQSGLNDVHSVFGKVILYDAPGDGTPFTGVGRQVCDAINSVATNSANDKPLTDVVINSVTIRRVGTTAQNFDEHAQGLPEVKGLPLSFDHQGAVVMINADQPASSLTRFTSSENLQSWATYREKYRDQDDTVESTLDISADATGKDQLFFLASQVSYPAGATLWPSLLSGKTLSITEPLLASQQGSTWIFTFTSETAGTYATAVSSGSFTSTNISVDGLGTRKYIETTAQYTFNNQQYDVSFRIRISKDSETTTLFQGRQSGVVLLSQNGTVGASGSTSGNMTLTR